MWALWGPSGLINRKYTFLQRFLTILGSKAASADPAAGVILAHSGVTLRALGVYESYFGINRIYEGYFAIILDRFKKHSFAPQI